MAKKRIWPFKWTAGGLGLKGIDRARAEAYYTMDGRELMETLAEIEHGSEGKAYDLRMLQIRRDYDDLTDLEMTELSLELFEDKESKEYKIASINLKLARGDIIQQEHDKEIASIHGEPWVGYIDHGLDRNEDGKLGFYFDFDWNDEFIKELKEEGYEAQTPEIAVRMWYGELCRTIAIEEGLSLDFMEGIEEDEDSKEKTEETPATSPREPAKDGKRTYS